ncbi:MAG: VOC family protein [Taibaiella sp.]|nr:VOC family protein [Taibaiella sp.]
MDNKKSGRVVWMDLTVPNADEVSEFYSKVVGWDIMGLDMGGYNDYCMNDPRTGETVAGVCHARGVNAHLPPQWLIYLSVENLDESLQAVEANGGKVLGDKRSDGKGGYYCLVQDPAGAYLMIAG